MLDLAIFLLRNKIELFIMNTVTETALFLVENWLAPLEEERVAPLKGPIGESTLVVVGIEG